MKQQGWSIVDTISDRQLAMTMATGERDVATSNRRALRVLTLTTRRRTGVRRPSWGASCCAPTARGRYTFKTGSLDMRPCLSCGALTRSTRCPAHERANDHTRRPAFRARYGPGWDKRRAETIAAEPWCHTYPHCPYPDAGSAANPLTADHSLALVAGGSDSPLVTRCRRCNSGKGAR